MLIAKALPRRLKLWIANALDGGIRAVERTGLSHRHSLHLSQAGQDLWVHGEAFNEQRQGYFVDIGAHDGVRFSNTYLLERRYGWTGICVEANPASFVRLQRHRRVICVNACLDACEQIVSFAPREMMGGIVSDSTAIHEARAEEIIKLRTSTLGDVLTRHSAPREIDYLSMDIEGAEERTLRDFNFDAYRFKCVTIERPSTVLRGLLAEHGYLLIKDIPGLDCFYVHESFLPSYLTNVTAYYEKRFLVLRWWSWASIVRNS